MRRRAFLLAGLAGALTPLPLAAQQLPTRPHVGILNYADDDDLRVRQFQAALAAVGYVEGKSLALTLRSANGAFDRLPALADELVAAKVDAIIALGPPGRRVRQPRPSRSWSRSAATWWRWASSRAWRSPAATSPASPTCPETSRRNGLSC